MIAWIGIDVAKKDLVVCFVRDGQKPYSKKFENSQNGYSKLLAWVSSLADPNDCHFCMESTGPYSLGAACFLAENNYSVTVENPRRIKHFAIAKALKCKTDKVDAHTIAEYAKVMQPRLWHLKDPARREVSMLQARHKQIEEMRQMELNRLEDPYLPLLVKSQIQEHVELLDKQEQAIIDAYPALLAKCETVKTVYDAVTKIRGIGHECGLLFACDIDVFSFDDGKYVASFAGMSPRLNQSGAFRGKSRITKEGNSRIRCCFFMASRSAVRFNPILKEFFDRLRERGLTKKQAYVAVARKLLIYCYGIAKKALHGETPIYPGGECRSRRPWSKESERKLAESLTC